MVLVSKDGFKRAIKAGVDDVIIEREEYFAHI